jgi:hypothetical protein
MDEDSLRAALTRIADDPEPPARIDIQAARRLGRRHARNRLVAQVAAGPLAIALAVGAIVIAPHALSTRAQRPVPAAPARPSAQKATPSVSAPAKFNPLVPYATFGWLPSGFSEGGVSSLWRNPFQSGTSSLTIGAQDPSGRTLLLTVYARGACGAEASGATGSGLSAAKCPIDTSPKAASRAPDINGRPAWYAVGEDGISWEYAPDAWATLDAAAAGQVPGEAAVPAKPGLLVVSKPALESIARSVKYGQETPIVFPFRLQGSRQLGGPLPVGWKLTSVSFGLRGKALVGRAISAGLTGDASALSISAIEPDGYGCTFVPGQSSYVTRYGVAWIDRVVAEVNNYEEVLCSTGSSSAGLVGGLQVFIYLEANSPGASPGLAGVKSLAGAFAVYARMKLLGSNPASWTKDPLG